jgi:mannosyltransferase
VSQAPTPQRHKPPAPAGGSAPPPVPGTAPPRTPGWAAAAAACAPAATAAVAMLVLGWWGIARDNSMGNDEVATRWAALLPLRELAHLLGHVDAVHGLYYLLMHGWVALGSSPVVLRIPSVIAMAVAAVLMVIIGRRLTGSGWAGLFAGLIMVLTPSISFYAQTARSYAMVFACVLGSTLALMYALEAEAAGRASRRRWLVYAVLVALGGYLNEMSLLVLAAHAVTVLLARYGQPAVERWLWAAGGGAALVVPLVLLSIKEHAALGWVSPPDLTDLRVLAQDYFGAETVAAGLLVVCAVVALLPPRGTWRWLPGGAEPSTAEPSTAEPSTAEPSGAEPAGREPRRPWWRSGGVSLPSVAAPLLVLPAAILMIESLLLRPLYVDRYVLYGEAGAALLAGGGLYRIGRWAGDASGRRALVWLPGVIVCLCVLVLQLAPQHNVRRPGSRRYDYGGPSRYVGANARPGDGILFFGKFYRKAKLGYPGDFRDTSDFAQAASPLQVGNFQGRDKPAGVTLPLMLGYRRIWVYGARPSLRRPEPELRAESRVLLRRYTLIRQRQFHGILVTLWQRR